VEWNTQGGTMDTVILMANDFIPITLNYNAVYLKNILTGYNIGTTDFTRFNKIGIFMETGLIRR
jgi:hypothetical protein